MPLQVRCDGTGVRALVPAQDFKSLGDGDTLTNTGGIVTTDGSKLLEYNMRFGDLKAESLAPFYDAGLFDLLSPIVWGRLMMVVVEQVGCTVTVVLASHNYPKSPATGDDLFKRRRPRRLS